MQWLDFGQGQPSLWEGLPEALAAGAMVALLLILYKLGKDFNEVCEAARSEGRASLKVVQGEAAQSEGRASFKVVQDSISETERSERLRARKSNLHKKEGPPGKPNGEGEFKATKPNSPSPIKIKGRTSSYPTEELEDNSESELSESEILDSEEKTELDEKEKFHPDKYRANKKPAARLLRPRPFSL